MIYPEFVFSGFKRRHCYLFSGHIGIRVYYPPEYHLIASHGISISSEAFYISRSNTGKVCERDLIGKSPDACDPGSKYIIIQVP